MPSPLIALVSCLQSKDNNSSLSDLWRSNEVMYVKREASGLLRSRCAEDGGCYLYSC